MDNLMSELTRPTSCYDGVGRCRTESIMEEAAARIAELEASLSDRWENLNVLDGEIDALRERIAELEAQLARPLSMTPRQLAKEIAQGHNYSIGHPPTDSAVPEARYPDDGMGDDDAYNAGWNDCREAMRAAVPDSATGTGEG